VKAHIKEQKATFQRFNAQWTPTQILLDPDGIERHRIEGFLPVDDFLAQLDLGLGKLHFQRQEYAVAEKMLRSVCESFPKAGASPEACYWAGVAAYKDSNDARHLASTAQSLKERYPESEWARKASVWSQ
jgi:outer membrane protein assembly factor BamD (BamD/ComL family)